MSEEETTAQKWLHALHLDNEMDECEGGRSSNPSLKSVRHSKRDDSWTSFTFTALPDTIEEFRVRPTNRIPCRSFTLGCGWGIGSGAIAAVRLPKILVLPGYCRWGCVGELPPPLLAAALLSQRGVVAKLLAKRKSGAGRAREEGAQVDCRHRIRAGTPCMHSCTHATWR